MKAEFDMLVIGGGITGAGIARLGARNGLRVLLLVRGVLMSGASSASSDGNVEGLLRAALSALS